MVSTSIARAELHECVNRYKYFQQYVGSFAL